MADNENKKAVAEGVTEPVAETADKAAADTAAPTRRRKEREPLFHIIKRTGVPLWLSVSVRVAAILVAVLLCGLITMAVTKNNSRRFTNIFQVYSTYFKGAFDGQMKLRMTIQHLTILLGISLAVTPAFRMRFWNIGAEGQTLIGCLACAACMFYFGGRMSEFLLILVCIVASVGAGVVWGLIPAAAKAFWNTNETLFTLMMNYVAIQLVEFFLKVADKSGSNTVGPNLLKYGRLPLLFGRQYLLNYVIVAVLVVLMYVYLNYTKHGYEISVVGESENTARYVGINVKKVIVRTMILSGALCGLIGLLLVGGSSYSIDSNLVGGRGFTAILVSWLAKFNPLYMILASFLLVFMQRGASEVSTLYGLNSSFGDVLTGLILFMIIGCEFFIHYKLIFNFKRRTQA